jgi:TM2 domain-containing membrane protein YozV
MPVIVTAPKSRSLAVLLALLLGGIGLHKFYLNSPGVAPHLTVVSAPSFNQALECM